jgi:hypothetical protein
MRFSSGRRPELVTSESEEGHGARGAPLPAASPLMAAPEIFYPETLVRFS